MVRARWWPLAGTKSGRLKRRSRKRVREVFLGPEIVFSGELKSCDAVVAEGTVESSRIECRKFILGSAGCCKGEVQAESAVIRGRFEGRLIVRARLLIKAGGHVRGSVQYGQLEIEPGGELQGDMVVHPASKCVAEDELDILDIPARRKLGRATGSPVSSTQKGSVAVPNGTDDRAIEAIPDRLELAHR